MITMPIFRTSIRRDRRSGFTLFELLITLAVVGLLIGLVIGVGNQFGDHDLKRASNQLASTIRYLYNKAALDGISIRLVLDIDERSYWVEATGDPALLSNPSAFDQHSLERRQRTREKIEEENKVEEENKEKVKKLLPKEPTFSPVSEYLLKSTTLPNGVYIKDVFVEHEPKAVEGGKATITFFPNGYVEAAVVNLRDADDEIHYSLATDPLIGEVSVTDTYRTFGGDE